MIKKSPPEPNLPNLELILSTRYPPKLLHTSSLLQYSYVETHWEFVLQVEIVMGLEEEFGITMEEDKAKEIATVQQAAELIEELVQANAA